jgi:eukaryotic-like serine/threonine-protein kinase
VPDATQTILGNKYRLVRMLGDGAAGVVWEAENTLVGKRVALKVLHRALAQNPDIVARFLAEARAAARIAHRNVVDVFDLGEAEDGTPYMVMELLRGETFDAVVARGALGASYACELVIQVLAALEAAHELGIIHRDLKPANIMVVRPRPEQSVVKVLDFGIAMGVFADGAAPEEHGMVFGTPEYMPPEQATGAPVDARSDLYAAGAVLYELLTGRPPFEGDDPMTVLAKVLTQPPRLPSTLAPGLPPDIEALVMAALAKDPEERPPTAHAMAAVLTTYCRVGRLPSIAPRKLSEAPIPLVARAKHRDSLPEVPAPVRTSRPKLELVMSDSTIPPPAGLPGDESE